MTKESVFIEYMDMFSKLDFAIDVKSSAIFKGNLSTFIEWFFDTDEWNGLDSQIREYVNCSDVNSLCFLLAEKLYYKTIDLPDQTQSQNELLKFLFELDEELYKSGKLKTFSFVPSHHFPNWMYPINYAFFSEE